MTQEVVRKQNEMIERIKMPLLLKTTYMAHKRGKLGIKLLTEHMFTVFFMWQRHSLCYIEDRNQIRLKCISSCHYHLCKMWFSGTSFLHSGIKMFRFMFKLMSCFYTYHDWLGCQLFSWLSQRV